MIVTVLLLISLKVQKVSPGLHSFTSCFTFSQNFANFWARFSRNQSYISISLRNKYAWAGSAEARCARPPATIQSELLGTSLDASHLTRKSDPSTIKLPNHQKHRKAPMFLHNPKAHIHFASNVAPQSFTPGNE